MYHEARERLSGKNPGISICMYVHSSECMSAAQLTRGYLPQCTSPHKHVRGCMMPFRKGLLTVKRLETLRGGGNANASLLSSILLLSLSKHLSWIIKTGKLLKWSHFDMQKKFWETCSVGGFHFFASF